jgi:hypothetical protein
MAGATAIPDDLMRSLPGGLGLVQLRLVNDRPQTTARRDRSISDQ